MRGDVRRVPDQQRRAQPVRRLDARAPLPRPDAPVRHDPRRARAASDPRRHRRAGRVLAHHHARGDGHPPNAEELYENPLLQLWLPRLLSGDLADTLSWRRFGLVGWWPIVLLAVGLVVAALGVVATTQRGRTAQGTTVAARVILALLIVAAALPIPAGAALDLPLAASGSGEPGSAIPATGAYRVTAGGEDRMLMWGPDPERGPAAHRDANRVPGDATRRRRPAVVGVVRDVLLAPRRPAPFRARLADRAWRRPRRLHLPGARRRPGDRAVARVQ